MALTAFTIFVVCFDKFLKGLPFGTGIHQLGIDKMIMVFFAILGMAIFTYLFQNNNKSSS
jgi:lysylphosphatidylglycerol synthetase-like protein (DUF2156 family)